MRRIGAVFNSAVADLPKAPKPDVTAEKPRKTKSKKGEKQCTPTTNTTGTSTGEN